MDTSQYIQSCNPARFVITCSLLIFSILFALRIDEYIKISYWLVFLPLFIWKMLVVFGACTGVFVWCKSGERNRFIRTPDNDCRALIIYFVIHILIFTFELLSCDKLENHLDTRWIICFIPLLLCTVVCFISCLWSLKAQRNFLIQTFIAANGLFFLFFPLRLDYFLTWRYVVVFIPVWISLCIALLFVITKLILAIVHRCSRRLVSTQRDATTVAEAIIYTLIFVPFSIFSVGLLKFESLQKRINLILLKILLVDRLDNEDTTQNGKTSYSVISIPLYITLIAWLTFSFGATDSNPWWFGLRRDLCEIILGQCPFVSLYFNNQYKFQTRPSTNDVVIDMTTSTIEKNIEPFNIQQFSLTTTETNNEKNLIAQHQFMSLLEPD
ncbi:unnamed protein product [Adineta steineri]|uniref:Uncharacterized protein n=1 Tax=Adineta steineri TaxID=433720 RepID=A0A815EU37_9BILA|nr:unnamed protein product [Adineta steineri]CAF1316081.1 unnamed protein product [Adineta steineri]